MAEEKTETNALLADKKVKEKEGTDLRKKDHLFFEKKFLTAGLALVGLIFVITIGYTIKAAADGDDLPMTGWMVTAIILFALAGMAPDRFKKYLSGLAMVVLIIPPILFFSPLWEWLGDYANRGINYGDWSDPSGYVPRVDGGTFRVPAGSIRTVDISGRVRIPIPVHHCLDIKGDKEGDFLISWDDSISNAFVVPKSGGVVRGTIEALPAERCGN